MRYCAQSKYLSSRPTLLISKDTFVTAVNPAARDIGILSVGDRLSKFISPIDCLKFEAASKCLFTLPPLLFPVSAICGYSYAAAYFEEIIGRRFAVTVLYKNREECIADTCEGDDRTPCVEASLINSLIEGIVGLGDDALFACDRHGMFELKEFTRKILTDTESGNSFFDCDLVFDDPGDAVPFDCPGIENFIKALSLMLFAANDLSSDRKVTVTCSLSSQSPFICMKTKTQQLAFPVPDTDYMSEIHPSLSASLSLCEYCAGCCGMEFIAESQVDRTVVLTLKKDTRYLPEADFKCPEGYGKIEEYYEEIFSMLDIIRSSEKQ